MKYLFKDFYSKCDPDSFTFATEGFLIIFFLSSVIKTNEDLIPNSLNRKSSVHILFRHAENLRYVTEGF